MTPKNGYSRLYVIYARWEQTGKWDWHQLHYSLKSARASVKNFNAKSPEKPKHVKTFIIRYNVEREK